MNAPDVEEGTASEDEEAPLVARGRERTDEAADDDDPCEERGGQDVRE